MCEQPQRSDDSTPELRRCYQSDRIEDPQDGRDPRRARNDRSAVRCHRGGRGLWPVRQAMRPQAIDRKRLPQEIQVGLVIL